MRRLMYIEYVQLFSLEKEVIVFDPESDDEHAKAIGVF